MISGDVGGAPLGRRSKYCLAKLTTASFLTSPTITNVAYFLVPLNIMCSSICESPARPMISLREPTLYQICTVMTGAFGSSTTRTLRPFCSTVSCTRGPVSAASDRSAAKRAADKAMRATNRRLTTGISFLRGHGIQKAGAGRRAFELERKRSRQCPKLPAGAEDLAAFALPDVGCDVMAVEDGLKPQHHLIRRPPEPAAGKFIEWN